MTGYIPGHMAWNFGGKLNQLGEVFINKKADKTCHIDRKLITGASALAANHFGKLSATELLKEVNKKNKAGGRFEKSTPFHTLCFIQTVGNNY